MEDKKISMLNFINWRIKEIKINYTYYITYLLWMTDLKLKWERNYKEILLPRYYRRR